MNADSLKVNSSNIIPIVGAIGTANYDGEKDQAIYDPIQNMIWGFDNQAMNFGNILSKVDSKDQTKFLEMTIGSADYQVGVVETGPILLNNGNVIEEQYMISYKKDKFQIKVKTRLLENLAA